MPIAITGALLLWALLIAVVDWRWRKVPNSLLLALLLPALLVLVLNGQGLQSAGWGSSLFGMGIALGLTLPGYLVSRLGAGDVKLAAVMGLVQGWPVVAWTLLVSALLLGSMALLMVLHFGLANARSMRMPAAIALAGGFITTLLLHSRGWL